jgi:hypothetical protein
MLLSRYDAEGVGMRDFRKIMAWEKADDLVVLIYELTKAFPAGLYQHCRKTNPTRLHLQLT